MTDYIESNFHIQPMAPGAGILIAELGEIGYDSFIENEDHVLAYIPESEFREDAVKALNIFQNAEFRISFRHQLIQNQNWNQEWEKNFKPVIVSDKCSIRAPFHEPPSGMQYDIIITPKMSFGTGHHETTSLMVERLLNINLKGKVVLDMGCGTGVLAIMASKAGAASVTAIDNDTNCYENSIENVNLNECSNIKVLLGDANELKSLATQFDLIVANINRNILVNDLPVYGKNLAAYGDLFMSGFFSTDVETITNKAMEHHLVCKNVYLKNNWALTHFKKER